MDKRFVIDNSVVMAWCFEDEISPYADFVLGSLKNMTAIVPSIWPLEVGNVLTVVERKKRLNEAASNKFIALLSELPIIVDQEPPERMLREILSLARKNQLSTYDASYLDLAMKRGLPIATLDDRLIAAAKQNDVRVMAANLDL
ncbi:MAG: type II toxin-antitoxin system VapC family toxin [Desulfosalsimonadaceae bacterium]